MSNSKERLESQSGNFKCYILQRPWWAISISSKVGSSKEQLIYLSVKEAGFQLELLRIIFSTTLISYPKNNDEVFPFIRIKSSNDWVKLRLRISGI